MKFILSDSILNRLKKDDYGIITDDGSFRTPYMYYFFLGKFLSKKSKENQGIIGQMCEQSHLSLNYLTLLFIIHHTNDDEIIDDILLRTRHILKNVAPAKLDRTEIANFRGIVDDLQEDMLSGNGVERERGKETELRDITEVLTEMEKLLEEQVDDDPLNDTYRILKNDEIIDDILLRTRHILKNVAPAKLDRTEIANFRGIVDDLQENMLSGNGVERERGKERELRDITEILNEMVERLEEQIDDDPLNDTYRILKNNEIIGQILRNKYGSLERPIIKEAIETIADSGLRLVTLLLDKDLITTGVDYASKKYPDYDLEKIKESARYFLFLWTIGNVGKIVNSINVPGIREIVDEVVQQKSTPAYDLIGYFNLLDSVEKLTDSVKQALQTLLKKHNDSFFRAVLSMKTQHYMRTHRSDVPIEQSVHALLYPEKRYSYKPVRSTTRRADQN